MSIFNYPIISVWKYKLPLQPEFYLDLNKNTIHAKANVLSMYAKFQLHPLLWFLRRRYLNIFRKFTLHVALAINQIKRFKPCTHGHDLHIHKFCVYANFKYVSKSIFYFASTWLFKISRICQTLKFNSIKMIDISFCHKLNCDRY